MNWGKVQRYYLMRIYFLSIFVFPKVSNVSRAVIIGIYFVWHNYHFHDRRIMCSANYNEGSTAISFYCCFMLLYFSWTIFFLFEKSCSMNLDYASFRFVAK